MDVVAREIRWVFIALSILLNLKALGKVEIEDSLGVKFEKKEYRKIVSLAPSITEILKFLDLSSNIVGTTRYCEHNSRKLGGLYDVDLEGIIKLNPDIVFLLRVSDTKVYDFLRSKGIPAFVLEFRSLSDIISWARKISTLTGTFNSNRKKIKDLEHLFDSLAERARKHVSGRRFFVMYSYPTIYTASSNSYVAELIRRVGGINLSDSFCCGYQTIITSVETVLKLKPDIVLITDNNFEAITNELQKLGLNAKFIYIDPMDISPSIRITNFMLKMMLHESLSN
ncbi:MAG: helical backbone metal receptor [Brevinematia bacterium]